MLKYTQLKEKINLIHDKENHEKLAFVTHYLQNLGSDDQEYFRDLAAKQIPEDLKLDNIIWDIPFPPVDNPKFKFIDLFAGIGGMRLAFQNLGGKCVFSSEWDLYAQKTYQANFGEVPFGDITQIDEEKIPDHDILVAGFPCQAFSIAGKRGGFEDTRGTLFFDVARIIRAKKPKAFFLENVKGLKSHDKGRTLETILNTLRNDLGYFVPDPQIINAVDFGVPQNRERIFIVGFSPETGINEFTYPSPQGTEIRFNDIREVNPVSVKYYLSTTYLQTLRDHKARHAEKGNGFGYEIIPDDGIANAIVVGGMGRERNLVVDKRLKDFTPITHIKGEVNREGIRKMTPREWARLQGFPDKFNIIVSDVQAYKQFGNSVAVPAVQATASRIIDKLLLEKSTQNSTLKLNKSEWLETYTTLKLLADGKLYAADVSLNKLPNIYYPLIKIIRKELESEIPKKYEYQYESDVNIKIVDVENGLAVINIPVQDFKNYSLRLMQDIIKGEGRSFEISQEVEKFLKRVKITKSERSDKKKDISIIVQDSITGFTPTLGFSLKTELGKAAPLLNASEATNFVYKFKGSGSVTEEDLKTINDKFDSTKDRINELEKLGFNIEFYNVQNATFNSNLQMLDSALPKVISEILLSYYKGTSKSSMTELLKQLEKRNPCNFDNNQNHPFYQYKVKNLLIDIALGMAPGEVWNGGYDANSGYLIVKEDGELVCYHVYNREDFQDYLLLNTILEQGDRGKNKFGNLYMEDNEVYIKLNLQISFK